MHVLLLLVYLGIAIWRKWRAYNKHFKWKHHLSWTVISYEVLTRNSKRTKWSWIAHLRFLKLLLYRYLLETGHAPGDPPGGTIFDHRVIVWTNLNIVHWVMLHTIYLDPVVSDSWVSLCFHYVSQCKFWHPGWGHFDNSLNKFGRVPLGDATYK